VIDPQVRAAMELGVLMRLKHAFEGRLATADRHQKMHPSSMVRERSRTRYEVWCLALFEVEAEIRSALSTGPAKQPDKPFVPTCDLFTGVIGADKARCDGAVAYVCVCQRCDREPTGEKFFTCVDHPVQVADRHMSIRGRSATWRVWGV